MYAALEVAQNASSYVSRQKRKVILLPQALRQPLYLLGIDYLSSTYWQQQRRTYMICLMHICTRMLTDYSGHRTQTV